MQALVNTRRGTDGTVVAISGEIDVSCGEALGKALGRAMRRHGPHLMLDLSGVTFIDCAGLTILLRAHRRAERSNGSLRVVAASDRARQVIWLTGLQGLFYAPARTAPGAEVTPAPAATIQQKVTKRSQ
jgi:anti-sigma B factor antagonist